MLIVIPARYGSTRFPGKPLHPIAGHPMIEHVYRQCARVPAAHVCVATDDQRILQVVRAFGGTAELTSPDCATGTDRIAEIARQYDDQIILNVQGDEPLIRPDVIQQAADPLQRDSGIQMASLCRPLADDEDPSNPNLVKVLMDCHNRALYFSRSPIPYARGPWDGPYWIHLGIYAYRRNFLLEFVDQPRSALEQAEELEQLRALEMGTRIVVTPTQFVSVGVDVPDDVQRVERLLPTQ